MREYIVNLTDDLISKNRYDALDLGLRGDRNPHLADLVYHVKLDLESGDFRKMNPETLGRIMANFEIGDVLVGKKELLEQLHFSGDCEEFLRELVAPCLAYVIRDRLDCSPNRCPATLLYRCHQPKKGVQR